MGALGYWKLFEQAGDASLTLLYFSERSRKMKVYCVMRTEFINYHSYSESQSYEYLDCVFSRKEKAFNYCKSQIEELSGKNIDNLVFDKSNGRECEWKVKENDDYYKKGYDRYAVYSIVKNVDFGEDGKEIKTIGFTFCEGHGEEETGYYFVEQEVLD